MILFCVEEAGLDKWLWAEPLCVYRVERIIERNGGPSPTVCSGITVENGAK